MLLSRRGLWHGGEMDRDPGHQRSRRSAGELAFDLLTRRTPILLSTKSRPNLINVLYYFEQIEAVRYPWEAVFSVELEINELDE